MNLIDEIKKLQGLERQAEPDWFRGDAGNIYCKKSPERYPLLMPYGINASASEVKLAVDLRNLAPDMLRVLECFREGDAEILSTLLDYLESNIGVGDPEYDLIEAKCIKRLQAAAALMEHVIS